MPDQPKHSTMDEILDALSKLAERVQSGPRFRLEPFVAASLRKVDEELRCFVPGLDIPPDAEGAQFLARAGHAALEDGNAREALARALRGMALSPHHPSLWYLAASCCFEFGAVKESELLLD